MKQIIGCLFLTVALTSCITESALRRKPSPDKIEESAVPAEEAAHVTLVNAELGFVVIDYGTRAVPAIGAHVELFRGAPKVATVRLTEPARGTFITGDILEGAPRIGDVAH